MNTWKTLGRGILILTPNPTPVKIVYNPPHTVIEWTDGTSTRVTCHPDDTYSKELGLAYCLAKKLMGNDWYARLQCREVDLTRKPFDWQRFKREDIAVHCENRDEVLAFVERRKAKTGYPSCEDDLADYTEFITRKYGDELILYSFGFERARLIPRYTEVGYKVIPFDSVRDWGME